jgi:hypothetical protein
MVNQAAFGDEAEALVVDLCAKPTKLWSHWSPSEKGLVRYAEEFKQAFPEDAE